MSDVKPTQSSAPASSPSTSLSNGLAAARVLERLSDEEVARAWRVEGLLPALREAAGRADGDAAFEPGHVARFQEAGLLGLVVPPAFGGLGGSLRDLCGATFALGTACPSTALAYFFHCSSASRGLLALEAIDAGLFSPEEAQVVKPFAEKLLRRMGEEGLWLANFASESVKTAASAVTISTVARKVEGGWQLDGVKSFGCATGIADLYLVTASLENSRDAGGLCLFFVPRDAPGVSERQHWDALGMRGTATHGIVLKGVFVPEDEALAVPGAFVKMMQMSRGSFVGNQLASTAVYVGAAQSVFDTTLHQLSTRTFEDTGRPIGESPMHQELLGRMLVDLETAYLWLRRQLELETSEPPLKPKDQVVRQWRLAKGEITEAAFRVAVHALKAGGTSSTGNAGLIARGLRDLCMGLVQAFPAERGRLEAARMVISSSGQHMFGVKTSG